MKLPESELAWKGRGDVFAAKEMIILGRYAAFVAQTLHCGAVQAGTKKAGPSFLLGTALSLATAFAIVLLTGEATLADCTPQAANGVTATCSGNTINQGADVPGSSASFWGYGTSNLTGVTVTVTVNNNASVTGTVSGINLADAIVINNAGATISGSFYGVDATTTFAHVTNSGSIIATTFAGVHAFINATVINNAGGSITGPAGVVAETGTANVTNFGSITGDTTANPGIYGSAGATVINHAGATIVGGAYGVRGNNGLVAVTNSGSISATDANSYGIIALNNATVTVTNNAGAIVTGGILGIRADGFADITNSGNVSGTFSASTGIVATRLTLINNAGGSITGLDYGVRAGGGSSVFNAGTISGGIAALLFSGAGNTLTLGPGSVISGNVQNLAGAYTFQLGGIGAATFDVSRLGPQYQDVATFNKINNSVWTLTGTSTYAGPINVNGGTLSVDGNIASASSVTVNTGGTLGGNGTVGTTTVNAGGALAPGNSIGLLTVQGSLTFAAASSYMIEVSPANADRTNVTGTANLGGATVRASFSAGSYVAKQYTILNAAGGLGGTTFGSMVNTNLPSTITPSLSYDSNNAYLNIAISFAVPAGLNQNQQAAGNALINSTRPAESR